METVDDDALRGVLEAIWLKVQMLHTPIDDVSAELIEEGSEGAYALGISLRTLFRSLRHDCKRLDAMFNIREGALAWADDMMPSFDAGTVGMTRDGEFGRDADPSSIAKAGSPHRARRRTV